MQRKRLILAIVGLVALSLALSACQPPAAAPVAKDKVTLQLKWVTQSQFAGYYAAREQGYYDEENLEVTINPGGPDIIPEQVVAGGSAQFGLDWLPSLLSAREQGTPLLNIAQVFQRSAMREIAFKVNPKTCDPVGVNTPADLIGRKVAVWFGGNEFELLATLGKYGIDKDKDVELIQQPFDMNLLLNGEVAAAAAMTYNELRQTLVGTPANPDCFDDGVIDMEDLVIIDFNEEGTAMLEDGIFVREDWLNQGNNKDIAVRFVRASLKGWVYCRDNPDKCVDIVMKQGPTLDRAHMTWMMREINNLIWPQPACSQGVGYMCPGSFQQTADIAHQFGVIEQPAGEDAYTHEIWEMAVKSLKDVGVDLMGQ